MKSRNVDWTNGSATSKVINLNETFGKPGLEVDPKNIIDTVQHRHFLDTLFLIDTDVAHAVSDIQASDKNSPAHRDMLVLFTRHMRKRIENDFLSKHFDSETSHRELPFAMSLKSKHLTEYY